MGNFGRICSDIQFLELYSDTRKLRCGKEMVPEVGLEPTWASLPAGFWVPCVYQFHHSGIILAFNIFHLYIISPPLSTETQAWTSPKIRAQKDLIFKRQPLQMSAATDRGSVASLTFPVPTFLFSKQSHVRTTFTAVRSDRGDQGSSASQSLHFYFRSKAV